MTSVVGLCLSFESRRCGDESRVAHSPAGKQMGTGGVGAVCSFHDREERGPLSPHWSISWKARLDLIEALADSHK